MGLFNGVELNAFNVGPNVSFSKNIGEQSAIENPFESKPDVVYASLNLDSVSFSKKSASTSDKKITEMSSGQKSLKDLKGRFGKPIFDNKQIKTIQQNDQMSKNVKLLAGITHDEGGCIFNGDEIMLLAQSDGATNNALHLAEVKSEKNKRIFAGDITELAQDDEATEKALLLGGLKNKDGKAIFSTGGSFIGILKMAKDNRVRLTDKFIENAQTLGNISRERNEAGYNEREYFTGEIVYKLALNSKAVETTARIANTKDAKGRYLLEDLNLIGEVAGHLTATGMDVNNFINNAQCLAKPEDARGNRIFNYSFEIAELALSDEATKKALLNPGDEARWRDANSRTPTRRR